LRPFLLKKVDNFGIIFFDMNTVKDISLKKMGFRTMLPNARAIYQMLEDNRDRLSPWFWWKSENVTPNFTKTVLFATAYVLDTKITKLKYNIKKSKTYDEQFLVFNNGKLAGMVGLDAIDYTRKDAEMWYFVTRENEGKSIANASLKILMDYALGHKNLNSLYAKTAKGNVGSENIMKRNNFRIAKIEFNVPTSRRNPRITDLTTWEREI
jgi:RimJ/RimL family protein N-acetyltransferase